MLTEQRKLATIMFTDMVGYTTLTQRNEPGALRLLEAQRTILRDVFARHGGNEVKTIGDGFLVEFDSALEAVKCGFEIQRSLRERNEGKQEDERIVVRVGIHLGDVVHSAGDVYGDAVNLASRVEPLAEPGGVCITQQVFDQVRNKTEFGFVRLGERELKHIELPVGIFKLDMPWGAEKAKEEAAGKDRIAILPLENISPDKGDDYFSEGLTEELIATVSKVVGLRVIARTSVTKYRGTQKGVAEIGKELGVGTVLEGSVRKAGDRIRVTVQLIDSRTEEHLWAETFDRMLDDVFAIQSEVAMKISEALRVQLLKGEKERIEKKKTKDVAAYNFYLRGMHSLQGNKMEDWASSVSDFKKAIELDDGFALAHAALSFGLIIQVMVGAALSRTIGPEAKAHAKRAIELDGQLAEAHVATGRTAYVLDWDWKTAEKEFHRAIELNPNLASAHGVYAALLHNLGRYDEAISEVKVAQELDPLSSYHYAAGGTNYYYMRKYEDAILEFKRAISIDPDSFLAHNNLGMCYVRMGNAAAGIPEIELANSINRNNPAGMADLAYAYAKNDEASKAKEVLEEVIKLRSTSESASVAAAGVYAILGDKEKALELLEAAYADRAPYLRYLKVEFWFESLRDDERFVELARKIGLP